MDAFMRSISLVRTNPTYVGTDEIVQASYRGGE